MFIIIWCSQVMRTLKVSLSSSNIDGLLNKVYTQRNIIGVIYGADILTRTIWFLKIQYYDTVIRSLERRKKGHGKFLSPYDYHHFVTTGRRPKYNYTYSPLKSELINNDLLRTDIVRRLCKIINVGIFQPSRPAIISRLSWSRPSCYYFHQPMLHNLTS